MRTCQVAYYDNDNNRWFGGILVNDEYIICGCAAEQFILTNFVQKIFFILNIGLI